MIICNCFDVSEDEIIDNVLQGCKSIQDIKTNTSATSGCGICSFDIEKLIQKHSPLT